ncbi:DUF2845 domain-containing protein [Corallococcus sp. RDP092CA]|uniref:DUF2845 domain-containing protein n=1 Tax=Corallococcus sp. RDP092CA TaxID=3109369 RepID=UPI0035ADD619
MRALPAALVVACLALPSLAHAASLRCDNKLVSEGASQSEAVAKCGEPVSKQTRSERTSNKSRQGTRNRGQYGESSTQVTTSSSVEEWTYNFGPNRLMQIAIFRDGQLVDVRSAGYGY